MYKVYSSTKAAFGALGANRPVHFTRLNLILKATAKGPWPAYLDRGMLKRKGERVFLEDGVQYSNNGSGGPLLSWELDGEFIEQHSRVYFVI